jgi:hypothetical protein
MRVREETAIMPRYIEDNAEEEMRRGTEDHRRVNVPMGARAIFRREHEGNPPQPPTTPQTSNVERPGVYKNAFDASAVQVLGYPPQGPQQQPLYAPHPAWHAPPPAWAPPTSTHAASPSRGHLAQSAGDYHHPSSHPYARYDPAHYYGGLSNNPYLSPSSTMGLAGSAGATPYDHHRRAEPSPGYHPGLDYHHPCTVASPPPLQMVYTAATELVYDVR